MQSGSSTQKGDCSISSELPNFLRLNLVYWCISMHRSVVRKDGIAIVEVKVTGFKKFRSVPTCPFCLLWNARLYPIKRSMFLNHHEMERCAKCVGSINFQGQVMIISPISKVAFCSIASELWSFFTPVLPLRHAVLSLPVRLTWTESGLLSA